MSTPSSQPEPVRSLVDDRRGAIMVVAVFMAAFLVGALWYIIGIGDTIIYRERMQDGADAVAYAGAVYHARGMNLIAMINIIMAGLLAVLIALKLAQVINTIAIVVSCAIAAACAVGAGCWAVPICDLTSDVVRPALSDAISVYTKFLKPTLKALSKTERGIAIAMPWVAEGKAVYIASKQYSKPVKTGGIISSSLLPQGDREGLPVQEDTYRHLCKKAGQYVGEVIFSPFGSWGHWVGGVIGGIAQTFPGYFCGSGGALGVDLNKRAVGQLCEQKKDTFDKKHEGESHPPKFDMGKCKKDGQKKLTKDVTKKVGKLGGAAGNMSGADTMTSKKVFNEAENGNGYFQVWSVVVGDDQWPKEADRGVEIAAWNKRLSTPGMPWGKVGFAEAEFYYDTSGKWDDYKDDAMWHMRWRARFRRVRPPTPNIGTIIGDVVGAKLKDKLGDKVSDLLKNDSFFGYAIGTSAADKFGKEMKKVLVGGGAWVDDKIQDKALKQYDKLQVIH